MRTERGVLTMHDIDKNAHEFLQTSEIDERVAHRCHQDPSMDTRLELHVLDQKRGSERVGRFIDAVHLDRPCFDQLGDTQKVEDPFQYLLLRDLSSCVSPVVLHNKLFLPPLDEPRSRRPAADELASE